MNTLIYVVNTLFGLIPVVAPFKSRVCDCSHAEIVYSNPTGAWISVFCEFYVLSGRGLCDGPIPRPDESYRVYACVALIVLKCSSNLLRLK